MKIGILDSGVGGLSIVRAIKKQLPQQDLLYYADTASFPYGEKSENQIRQLVEAGIRRLEQGGCKTIVLACNTASTQGLEHYQETFPQLEFIAVTPLVREAAARTKSGKIIVLATFATLASDYYRALKDEVPPNVTIYAQACFDWVRLVETGHGDTELIADQLRTFARHGIDTVVLGCTHFAFMEPLIHQAAPDLMILEPGASVAEKLAETVGEDSGTGQIDYLVTGNESTFMSRMGALLR